MSPSPSPKANAKELSACTSDKKNQNKSNTETTDGLNFTHQKIRKEVSYKTQQRKQGKEFKPTAKRAKRWNYNELLSSQPSLNKCKRSIIRYHNLFRNDY